MPHNNGQLHKVLIVDDEDMTQELLKHAIHRLNIKNVRILTAENGEDALAIVADEHPDLLLLDVVLPTMSGYDICREVRQIPNYDPYIIILTARGNSNDPQRAESIGANDFMTKPFNPSRLLAQLNQVWSA